ncbi:hypothetical protein FXF51_05665 [Nonomuraea sp. PA05]|uniref:hypothetical protein n=1 Tax=Nonomuraea sp. PA05 TaxID=2604466 RepID=UPI0011D74258|nr:hypothetical protein [Nonomuraea sp. PA05]TYB69647.1 hypothetical protein FXF51_05665 [Nonomuraea sp. PA05]
MTPPVLHNAEAAGKKVGKSASWMYKAGAAGLIPRTKIGGQVWWTDEQIAEIIRNGAQQPKQQPKPAEVPTRTQRREPQRPGRKTPQKRPAAPPTNSNIPVADRSVSRLYRNEGAA